MEQELFLPNYNNHEVEIIGVYNDYEFLPYFAQAQGSGRGSILTYRNSLAKDIPLSKISFKIDQENVTSTIAALEELYKATFPEEVFKWTFLDQNIKQHYAQEQIVRNQIILFTLLAIGIACLGLLGTTTNKVIEKTKEIGIRKVLGRPNASDCSNHFKYYVKTSDPRQCNWYSNSLLSSANLPGKIHCETKFSMVALCTTGCTIAFDHVCNDRRSFTQGGKNESSGIASK